MTILAILPKKKRPFGGFRIARLTYWRGGYGSGQRRPGEYIGDARWSDKMRAEIMEEGDEYWRWNVTL
jgi:hypothetical protein